jgi:serine/threonine protein kinase, bacterial
MDTAGNVYITDADRVLKLAAGTDTWTVLPFSGLYQPEALAVDHADAVYVADSGHNRVVKLAAGATTQTVLPFTGLDYPDSVAVDTAGAVYVTDWRNNRVLKLPAR